MTERLEEAGEGGGVGVGWGARGEHNYYGMMNATQRRLSKALNGPRQGSAGAPRVGLNRSGAGIAEKKVITSRATQSAGIKKAYHW